MNTISISIELIQEIMELLEKNAETIDGEFGKCREAEKIISDDDMPGVYYELRRILADAEK